MMKGSDGRHDVVLSTKKTSAQEREEKRELIEQLTKSENEEDLALNEDQID